MDLITSLSKKTINFIDKHDLINKTFTQSDYTYIENLIRKYRPKSEYVKITSDHVRQLAENGIMIFYGELFKYLIVLSIAYCLNIFLPTFIIMNTFSALRGLAGGVHMSTFNKCFVVMIVFFLSLGYLVTSIHINIPIIIISIISGYIWSIIIAYKYAPQERPNKSDKDCENNNKMKHRTIIFIVLSSIISVMFIHNQLISISIFTGVLLEMFTITSIGTRLFNFIDGKKV
jgi:accessory gene regulator B